jgi:hypothetical protein
VLGHQSKLVLLVPSLVVEEFERNRERIEASMTASVAQRFKLIKQDLDEYGGSEYQQAVRFVEGLAHEIPLIGAMTTRNFDEILDLLRAGSSLCETAEERSRVVDRALAKRAPFHRSRNSVADALLVELYATALSTADFVEDRYAFITSNSEDFSVPSGDRRLPHIELAPLFDEPGSSYALGVDGLTDVLRRHFGDEIEELFAESDFVEEPRRLDEIVEAEEELFDRIWHHRSLQHEYRLEQDKDEDERAHLLAVAGAARQRVEEKFTEPGQLGPYSDFELGMLNGKLSALRWVLGSEWDFLDT